MNKTYLIIALLGIGAYMLFRKSDESTEANASNDTLQPSTPPGTLAPKSNTSLKASSKRKKIDFKKLKEAVESGQKAVSVNSVLN
jgi:hypothetical protein